MNRRFTTLLLAASALPFAGCGPRHDEHAHHDNHDESAPDHHHEGGSSSATFEADEGLHLADETVVALGIETAAVAVRTITPTYDITASVFAAGPPARASALISRKLAEELERQPPGDPPAFEVRRDISSALHQVEIVLPMSGTPAVGSIHAMTLPGAPRRCATVPAAAVQQNASGSFVYVFANGHFRRTAVQTGARDGIHVEIVDGLEVGDVVVTTAVQQLWLTELRLTKGGGHSH